jgi:hypothetical protein
MNKEFKRIFRARVKGQGARGEYRHIFPLPFGEESVNLNTGFM